MRGGEGGGGEYGRRREGEEGKDYIVIGSAPLALVLGRVLSPFPPHSLLIHVFFFFSFPP